MIGNVTHRAAVSNFSAPPGVTGTAAEQLESAGSPDVVSTSTGAETGSAGRWGKAAALVGVGLTVAGVGMGMASPAQAHGWDCGVSTSTNVEYHYGHTDVVQESFNSCTGEHTIYNSTHGYVTHNDYHQVQRHHHGHHGHNHGHHDAEDAAAGFLFGLGLGIILGQ